MNLYKMYNGKKGGIDLLTGILIVIIAGLLLWSISSPLIKEPAEALANKLKEMGGLGQEANVEKLKEKERIEKELLSNAIDVFDRFGAIKKCLQDEEEVCVCDTIDFTKLNLYTLKISNNGQVQILELLDPKLVPAKDKRQNLGYFFIGPSELIKATGKPVSYTYSNPSSIVDIIKKEFNPSFVLFSKEGIIFNRDKDIKKFKIFEKLSRNINRISIIKVSEDTFVVDENNYNIIKCGEGKVKRSDAIRLFNALLDGYQQCSSKNYAPETRSGIVGACNCDSKLSLNDLHYKIEMNVEKISQGFWKTTLELKDEQDNQIMKGEINKLFKPCTRMIAGAQCPTTKIDKNILKGYSINDELWLAKGKVILNNEEIEQVFFADQALPLCPSS